MPIDLNINLTEEGARFFLLGALSESQSEWDLGVDAAQCCTAPAPIALSVVLLLMGKLLAGETSLWVKIAGLLL